MMLFLIAYTKQGAKLRRILHPAKLFAVFFRKTYSIVTVPISQVPALVAVPMYLTAIYTSAFPAYAARSNVVLTHVNLL